MAGDAGRLIVVSNRLPVRLRKAPSGRWEAIASDGGLVTALTPVLERRGGVWVGWPGTALRKTAPLTACLEAKCESWRYRLAPVFLDESEVRQFYHGFANEVLWPLFHDCFTWCNFDPRYWEAYQKANLKFARTAAKIVRPGDIIWVHDYQLMDVGRELRRLRIGNKIGFFNHIPFPTPDIFCRLPWRKRIFESLLDYDLLGFQLERDERHFFDCVRHMMESGQLGRRPMHKAEKQGRPRVGHFPISIDFVSFAARAAGKGASALVDRLIRENQGRQIVLGIDRLDYSKGLLAKLAGFRYALEKYPSLRGRITLVQYVVPSREKVSEYRTLRLRLERAVSEINGAFSEPGWIPVQYYFQSLDRQKLCAYYRASDMCLITSLKDGMNLIAKEFCAAQIDERGALILSEFAGSASELGEGALTINPLDVEAVCDAIYRAFTMSPAERAMRMRRLRKLIQKHDVHYWVDSYLCALAPATAQVSSPKRVAL
jgi:alpha,alpha-trehalose-phosphate synthase [UDP-forming]